MPRSRTEIGILLSVAGYSSWVASDVFVKLAGDRLSIAAIFTLSYLVGAIITSIIAGFDGGYKQLGSKRPWFQFFVSILVVAATFGSIAGVTYLSLADFYTIIFTSPLIMTVLGRVFLKEKPGGRIWLATCIGFLGVIIAVRFSGSAGHVLSLTGILATCLTSFSMSSYMLMIRATPGENSYTFSFWPRILGVAIGLGFLIRSGTIAHINIGQSYYCVLIGITGALGGLLTNLSLRYAPIAVVSPYHYTQIISGAVMGYLIWHNFPAPSVIAGAIIITASGLYILRHQKTVAAAMAIEQT